jgi:hypothetical protein
MSATERLVSNVHEYYELLDFLNENYPNVIEEWKGSHHRATTKTVDINSSFGKQRGDSIF